MSKGLFDPIRFHITTMRKGFLYISNIKKVPSIDVPSAEVFKECAGELGIEIGNLVDDAYELRYGDTTLLVTNEATLESASANWLCSNKFATYECLKRHGIHHLPYHRRYSLRTINEARQDFLSRNRPMVVKPSRQTYGGTGVTVNIKSLRQLNKAIFNSLVYDSQFLMEDFIEGDNFRILLYKDRMIDAVQRVPANVKGDGINDIKRLIEMTNEKRRKVRDLHSASPIYIDNELRQTLRDKGLSLDHVPAKDEVVYLRTVCNLSGYESRNVTDLVHPDTVRVCSKIMDILGVTLGGIDIITKDISKPLAETGGIINEVNTNPGLEIHDKTVAKNILRLLLGIDEKA
jgi:cyanophycin synthetase